MQSSFRQSGSVSVDKIMQSFSYMQNTFVKSHIINKFSEKCLQSLQYLFCKIEDQCKTSCALDRK